MKKYMITATFNRYIDAHTFLEGKSLEDPKLQKELIKWLEGFHYDSIFEEYFEEDFEPSVDDLYGIKAYEITEGPLLISNIWQNLKAEIDKREAEREKMMEEVNKQSRKERYLRLKEEFKKG